MINRVCRVKRGMLFLRDCAKPADATCTSCARPMCPEHTHREGTDIFCLECAAENHLYNETKRDTMDAMDARKRFYVQLGFRPFYLGRDKYLSDADFLTFDGQPIRDHTQPGTTADGGEVVSEEYLES